MGHRAYRTRNGMGNLPDMKRLRFHDGVYVEVNEKYPEFPQDPKEIGGPDDFVGYSTSYDLSHWQNVSDVEVSVEGTFVEHRCKVKEFKTDPSLPGRSLVLIQQPCFTTLHMKRWDSSSGMLRFLENNLLLLNNRGEFYLERAPGQYLGIHYLPTRDDIKQGAKNSRICSSYLGDACPVQKHEESRVREHQARAHDMDASGHPGGVPRNTGEHLSGDARGREAVR
jgi:hypothetical protein